MKLVSKKYIIKDKKDPVCAFKLSQSLKFTSSKRDKKCKINKKSQIKTKSHSGSRSLNKHVKKSKVYSPRTTRKENLPFEYKLNSKSSDKTYRKEQKKTTLASSKLSSWAEVKNIGANSEINSNLYRNHENPEINSSDVKKLSVGTRVKKSKS
mmetsp:Transcript_10592/g.9339  ORF Transcript_10592/g.9339 Transcript_10592/m.9339 type:complete len:153 (+) Transcript_10592:829-1287(+)